MHRSDLRQNFFYHLADAVFILAIQPTNIMIGNILRKRRKKKCAIISPELLLFLFVPTANGQRASTRLIVFLLMSISGISTRAFAGVQLLALGTWCVLHGGVWASAAAERSVLHRLQPASGRIVHMAGQSPTEFSGYSSFLPDVTRPVAFTTYFTLSELLEDKNKAERYFTEMREELDGLGDTQHVVLPHISVSMTKNVDGPTDGSSIPAAVIAGKYDSALKQFADAIPLLGRPLFLRIGYEFNSIQFNYFYLQKINSIMTSPLGSV